MLLSEEHLSEPHQSTSVRNRSFGGCSTCRSRHVKCDERHPVCSTCTINGLRCGGYEKNIFFTSEEGDDDDGPSRFRRPLFTEQERKNMSKSLTSIVPPKKAFRILFQIDLECENASSEQSISINHGPFGAFRIVSESPFPALDSGLGESTDESSPELIIRNTDDYLGETQLALSPWTQEILQPAFDTSGLDSLSLFPNSDDVQMNMSSLQYMFGPTSVFEPTVFPDTFFLPQGFGLETTFLRPVSMGARSPTPSISSLASSRNTLPPNALPLLQHYSSTVIGALTPYRHNKTPWHILFLPYVRQCLAVLVLNDHLDHAGMCIFYGALSLSAFSLGGSAGSPDFLSSAYTYQEQAQRHARIMLKHAYDIPKRFKYKSILMALLTLIHGCLFLDDRKRTENYLLEAEKLIRIRGLSRTKKSRKIRLLHHCYAFTRVIHESTSFVNSSIIDKRQRDHVASAVAASGVIVYGADMPTFRIRGWNNWNEEMMLLKPQDEGENDLHLERPGYYPATLYPEIFGLPEPWLLLLSQVIRLGNEKDAAADSSVTYTNVNNCTPLELRDFTNRAKAIERAINQLDLANAINQNSATNAELGESSSSSSNAQPKGNTGSMDPYIQHNILAAMQDALVIYFYRRIYDIDASMLQEKVCRVRDAMLRIQTYEINSQADMETDNGAGVPYGSAGFVWPVFIAACEAEEEDVQASFSQWFGHYARRSSLPSFNSTLELVQRVWREKKERPGESVSWLEVMKR